MNGQAQFEQRLQRCPPAPIPPSWREQILEAARAEASRCQAPWAARPCLPALVGAKLKAWLWPHPKAWAGLAAVWILIFAVDFSTRDGTPVMAEKAAPPSPEVIVELKQQQRMLAELIGAGQAREAEPVKLFLPQPRSERVEVLMT